MIKSIAASKAAQLIAACVCPVAGTTALTLSVPQVRQAVHKATSPRAYALPKTRTRAPANALAAAAAPCPDSLPVILGPTNFALTPLDEPIEFAEKKPLPPLGGGNPPPSPEIIPPKSPVPGGPGGGGDPVPIVPEVSTWVQLILGFGLVGGALRSGYRVRGSGAADALAAAEPGDVKLS